MNAQEKTSEIRRVLSLPPQETTNDCLDMVVKQLFDYIELSEEQILTEIFEILAE